MRRSECVALDVHVKGREIAVRMGNGGKARVVLVGDDTIKALLRWLRKHPQDCPALFTTSSGRPGRLTFQASGRCSSG